MMKVNVQVDDTIHSQKLSTYAQKGGICLQNQKQQNSSIT